MNTQQISDLREERQHEIEMETKIQTAFELAVKHLEKRNKENCKKIFNLICEYYKTYRTDTPLQISELAILDAYTQGIKIKV